LKKGKVKQGFIYENAQKKVLENHNFSPGKSLILLETIHFAENIASLPIVTQYLILKPMNH
jgi:hypothetical protein